MNQSFTTKSILQALFPDHNQGKDVYYQGSRQMTSTSRRYYEMELGAGMAPSPGMNEMFGYSEPLRRFIQREGFEPQANEIPNTMPSWMPGDDYYTNFRVGDPFIKVDQGFARLPGKGYEALHPELEGISPEDYPDINKMAILADVAPYSREYNTRSLRPAQQQNSRACAGGRAACFFSFRSFVGQGPMSIWPVDQLARWIAVRLDSCPAGLLSSSQLPSLSVDQMLQHAIVVALVAAIAAGHCCRVSLPGCRCHGLDCSLAFWL